ncbi:M42 glutamyl aminopeptidase family protein [Clostridioides difficile CD149]|uniref:M18 family aminopeptidase n=1 Tax=Clostridioides difficile TaxID=1496 RepID=UPI00038D501D|nr:M18 family aminopeptidase [Clostridioides difficile]OFU26617.1 M18 family aminopeptidase [Clostridium sp. HMSC19B12]EGT3655197.1 M18 family aminopeptidase [Clostridioides difficile]EGT3681927.1 M18 family aminopeptidase [Clostridioides difficile]EGT3690130.1 M18 family aminopeptidase [Clostridioides difficile]EGT3697712.1 M18 family aminopeptidase [Clostridioides difficile]
MDSINFAKNLIDFICDSPSSFHAVESTKEILDKNGFEELVLNQRWNLRVGGKYYVTKNLSAIVAFVVNSEDIERDGFRIIGSHSDSPTFSIKPNAEIEAEKSYLKLNTECYGGAILSTWLDRPLGIAGRVVLKGDSILKPNERLIDFKKPICIIPNLAIHLNRSINDGHSYNKQKDMLPLVGMLNDTLEKDNFLIKQIASNLDVNMDDIIDFDLFLYEFEKGSLIGANDEFISIGRQDNLAMVHASLNALVNTKGQHGVNVMAVFDNEEVGSSTKQGADSNMLLNILERICISMGKDREGFFESIYSSFMISSDLAHAIHPNIPEKHDPTNKPIMGKGPVIKINASQAYTSDGYSIAIYKNICREANVEYQEFVNRSDERGGSTIGPISSTHIDIPSVDVGSPILAMHSIRELGNVEDHYSIYKTFSKFFEI